MIDYPIPGKLWPQGCAYNHEYNRQSFCPYGAFILAYGEPYAYVKWHMITALKTNKQNEGDTEEWEWGWAMLFI